MKKITIVLGALAVCLVTVGCTFLYQTNKKNYYRGQLEQAIDNKALEGLQKMGAVNLNYECFLNDSVDIYKVGDVENDPFSHFAINTSTAWGGNWFNHTDLVSDLLEGGKYAWYEFQNCATRTPFFIVLEKTERGYDLTGECLLGMALRPSFPNDRIRLDSSTTKLSPFYHYVNTETLHHRVGINMINEYVDHLLNKVYAGTMIRKEVSSDLFGGKEYLKYEELNKLLMKSDVRGSANLYFSVNDYYELKPDEVAGTAEGEAVRSETGVFSLQDTDVFTQKITLHYSIQENTMLFNKELKKLLLLAVCIAEFIYLCLIGCWRMGYFGTKTR